MLPALLALALQVSPPAQTPPLQPDVVVEHPSEQAKRQEIIDLTAAPPGMQIARWHDALCV